MPLFKKPKTLFTVTQQGPHLVKRDADGRVVASVVAPKPTVAGAQSPQSIRTFRNAVYKMTDGGLDNIKKLIALRDGLPTETDLPDGRRVQGETPTPEVQRAAAMNLHEMLHGKAVAATEVVKAEKEAEDLEQYRAMSDADLAKAALPYLERVSRGELPEPEDAEAGENE